MPNPDNSPIPESGSTIPETEGANRWTRIRDFLLGVRKGFGDNARAIHVVCNSERRAPINWTLPALGILFGVLLLFVQKARVFGVDSMLTRVFVFDYLLFIFGGLSGWNMARRWRSHSDQIEEISLTPLPPAVIGSSLLAGPVGIWLILFIFYALIDFVTPFEHVRALTKLIDSLHLSGVGRASAILIVAIGHTLGVIIMAWFHFEAVRLAHWMFAVHALPRVSLLTAGTKNFVTMTIIVIALSGVGSVCTGIVIVAAVLVFAAMSMVSGAANPEVLLESYSAWAIAAIPGALVVIVLKRAVCLSYERAFAQAWLQYQWWGAAESRQPMTYPMHFRAAFPLWLAFYGMQEEEIAGVAENRKRHKPRYIMYLKRLQQQVGRGLTPPMPIRDLEIVTADKNSGFPFPVPGPRNEPLRAPEFGDGREQNSELP